MNGTEKIVDQKVHQNLDDFAQTLETIAQKLREDGKFTFVQGEDSIEIEPSEQVKVEYEYEIEDGKHEFEIEFEWYPDAPSARDIKIE